MNSIRYTLAITLFSAFSMAAAQDCSDIAGDWQGTWSETDCYNDFYSGEWTGEITSACEFKAINSWGNLTGAITPGTGTLTATLPVTECGALTVTGTFENFSASGSWSYSLGGSGQFTGEKQVNDDADGDGVPDAEDAFPNDPNEWADSDSDGFGDNSDPFPLDPSIFFDVQPDYWAFNFVETLSTSGITAGCGNDNYCPESPVTRSQMAVFLERGMKGSDYVPPAASGNVFLDVGAGDFAASWIEQLFADGITAGCGNNNYCPGAEVTRAQMAVFLLRAKYGSGYSPPPAVGVFDDVDAGYWAVHWIEQLASEGITAGCGNGNYCPEGPVNRAQMAVFLVRTFGL